MFDTISNTLYTLPFKEAPMSWDLVMSLTLFTLPSLLLVISLFLLLPQALHLFQKWKHTRNTQDFSVTILLSAAAAALLSLAYFIFMQFTLRCFDSYKLGGITTVLIYIILIYCTQSIFIPRALHFFQRWKKTHNPIYFSLLTLFCFISFYFVSFIYLTVISSLTWISANVS
jgi:hypothetical protein